jgi:hypothetical protein
MLLPDPCDFVDLNEGERMTLSIDRWEDGSTIIHPNHPSPRHVRQHMEQRNLEAPPAPGTPISVEIPVLRLYGQRVDQTSPCRYFDVTSKRLRADLLARLTNRENMPLVVTISASGMRPRKRYSVEQG